MKKIGKDPIQVLDQVCGNRDYRCWAGGVAQAANCARTESPKKVAEHLLEHHNVRAAKVDGIWWILD